MLYSRHHEICHETYHDIKVVITRFVTRFITTYKSRDHEINHVLKSLILKIHSNISQCEMKITVSLITIANMCLDFFPGCSSGIHCCSHNASIFICVHTTRPSRPWSTGVGMFHRPLLKVATHHRYSVPNICRNPSIQGCQIER